MTAVSLADDNTLAVTRIPGVFCPDALVAEARARRAEVQRVGRRRSAALASAVVLVWVAAVTATGQWVRVGDNAASAVTMVFGSFVAGSTPQGGGAVAFPVFTKLLGVSAADAATFSLCIQAIGMTSAALVIAFTGRAVDRAALRLTIPSAIAGYGAGRLVFAVVTLPSAYTKIVFTLVVATAGSATVLSRRRPVVEQLRWASIDHPGMRAIVVAVAATGGVASSLFGSGADVAVYLLLTIVLGVRPSIGVATSVITMASVSVVGLATSLATGELDPVALAGETDVFGMWLAAVPVVVAGAPLGSWFAGRAAPSVLAGFIAALAALELASTGFFLDELRTDPAVAAFGLAGVGTTFLFVRGLLRLRDRMAVQRSPQAPSIRRLDLELGVTS